MATFVWVYWHGGSPDNGEELRYSMRSVLANYSPTPLPVSDPSGICSFDPKELGPSQPRLIVSGDKPDWYRGDYIRIPRVLAGPRRTTRDSLNKLVQACKVPSLPPSIIWMMDDIYYLNPFDDAHLHTHYHGGYWSWGKIRKFRHRNLWQKIKVDTFRLLASKGFQTYDFATHGPRLVNRSNLLELVRQYHLLRGGLLWELLYGNIHYRRPLSQKGKLYRFLSKQPGDRIRRRIRPSHYWLNNGGGAWNQDLKEVLAERYPSPTPFERA